MHRPATQYVFALFGLVFWVPMLAHAQILEMPAEPKPVLVQEEKTTAAVAPEASPDRDFYTRWAAFYSDKAEPEQLQRFDLLVLDPDVHPPLRPILSHERVILGYLSIGEARAEHRADKLLKDRSAVLGTNPHWDSRYVDIRNPAWLSLIVEELMPALLQQGFDGVMLDTLDSAIALEEQDPKTYAGMKKAAVQLVRALRENYPDITIMVNRGFAILPEVAEDIDMVLAESIFTTHDFRAKKFSRVPEEHYSSIVAFLQKLQEKNPRLRYYSLDYWPLDDAAGVRTIYATQRKHGFVPYVATLDLERLVDEP